MSNGDGGTYKEYGYYGATAEDMSGKVIMVDTPFMYFDDGEKHNWNDTLVLITGSYNSLSTQRWYAASGSNAPELYLHESEIYGDSTNPTSGQQTGLTLGYIYQAMDISIKDSTLNPVATIQSGMAYKSSWNSYDHRSEFLNIENSTITHFKGYTPLNGAIATEDICVRLTGTTGSSITNNTFRNCGTSIYTARSPYYYTHTATEWGADNLTIKGNEFIDGG